MKKFNLFFLVLGLLTALLFSCSEKDVDTASMRTVDVTFEVSVADMIQAKAGALEGDNEEVVYCEGKDATFDSDDYVVVKYSLSTDATQTFELAWTIGNNGSGDYSQISELVQIDFPSDADVILTIEDFRVFDDASKKDLKFLTPKVASAYAGYVKDPVAKDFTIGLYEKVYMPMQVLCFNEEAIPLFGFAWTDFDVVTGDEICMFFNCLGTTAESRHQVLAADVSAYFEGSSDPYWEGTNYFPEDESGAPLSIEPFCIPCPGNWKTAGMTVVVTPMGSAESITIEISTAQIDAFLNGTQISSWEVADLYEAEVAYSNEVPYIHYVLLDCYKPKSYLVNCYDGVSDIYALSWAEPGTPIDGSFKMTKLFDKTGYHHCAMTPDETSLILVKTTGPADQYNAEFWVYDIYSLEYTMLDYEEIQAKEPGMRYNYTQLVYVEDQLYAGCQSNNCLTEIIIDFDKGTFGYGEDLIQMSDPDVVSGGDLLAIYDEGSDVTNLLSMTKDASGSIIRYYKFSSMATPSLQTPRVSDLVQVTGAVVVEGGSSAIVSQEIRGEVFLNYWTGGSATSINIDSYKGNSEYPNLDANSVGGDMASAFYATSLDDFETIFGVDLGDYQDLPTPPTPAP